MPGKKKEEKEELKKQEEIRRSNKKYIVLQVVLKEALIGSGSGNLSELEDILNEWAGKGYRLHTITTAASGTKGIGGGDRIQATIVFEKIE